VNILPPNDGDWTDLYIVSELMETDLHRIIYSKQDLSVDHCQYFVYQILRALKYMHSANVLHRDLKPSNLLLNSNCDLKVCDLGLARGVEPDNRPGDLTEYVVTRWYRAPEIMLACTEYSKAIDVWSTGCIFAELLERKAVFPGDDYIDQIRKICAKLGKPGEADLDFVTSEKARRFILDLPETPCTEAEFAAAFPSVSNPSALDLLREMLVFNPRRRCSVEQALEHGFMASLHMESDEPAADFCAVLDFERKELDRESLRELAWNEMLHYNPRLRPPPPPAPAPPPAPPAALRQNPPLSRAPAPPRGVAAAQLMQQQPGFPPGMGAPLAMLPGGAPLNPATLTPQQQQALAAQHQHLMMAQAQAQAQLAAHQQNAAKAGHPPGAPGQPQPGQMFVTTINGQQVVMMPTPAQNMMLGAAQQGMHPGMQPAMQQLPPNLTPQQLQQLQIQALIQQQQLAHAHQLAAQQQAHQQAVAQAAAQGRPPPPHPHQPHQPPPGAIYVQPGQQPPPGAVFVQQGMQQGFPGQPPQPPPPQQ